MSCLTGIQFEAIDSPGYVEHRGIGHSTSQHPLPEKCTIVLIKGAIRLDDEKWPVSGTGVGYQTEGSKTLVCETVEGDSVVVWWPRMCCWKSEECGLARRGRCKRMPGVVFDGTQKKGKGESCVVS